MVIRNGENLGYASGNNVGIRDDIKNGADYIWLLNTISADCLTELVTAGEKRSRVGLLEPTHLWPYSVAPTEFAASVLRQQSEEQYILTLCEAGEPESESGPVLVWGTASPIREIGLASPNARLSKSI